MKTLYIDCFAGIAGDMFMGAMLDLGVPLERFKEKMSGLYFHEYSLDVERKSKNGFMGTDAKVIVSHDGEHNYETVHDHEPGQHAEHHHDHHEHGHGHHHGHDHHHSHRGLAEIEQIIAAADLSENVKERSLRAFRLLAEAEGAVHGISPEEVHFHEVGAVDSIVDIVGAFVLLELAGVDKVRASAVNVGSGTVECAHGILPVPAPATARLLQGIPVFSRGEPMERTTPTGALLLRVLADSFGPAPDGVILGTGYGFGDRESDLPNLLRVTLYEEEQEIKRPYSQGRVIVMETNIDDMNPQDYQGLEESLFAAGALDVFFTPIMMKKMRPAVRVTCIMTVDKRESLGEIILKQSSSIGLRWSEVNRMTLRRSFETFVSSCGEVTMKISRWGDEPVRATVEYDDLRRLALETGLPVPELRQRVISEYSSGKDASK